MFHVSGRVFGTTLVVAAVAVGCGGKAKKTEVATPTQPASVETAPIEPAAASPQLGVSDDLAKQCELKFSSVPEAPKFDYDNFTLLPQDREVLEQVARCLTEGPLAGRKVDLVGRADPRGTQEYNLGLGTRRASTVKDYLRRLGVGQGQISTNTRGDLDASGADESSWREDRRVDLKLVN